jgi:uncharacterized protein
LKIWVDADACPRPVKEMVYKASSRLKVPVCLVANSYMQPPRGFPYVSAVQVERGPDVADEHIVDQVQPEDMVITADIPLAALVVQKGAVGLNPRGELYTEENVRERLSMRDFMMGLRETGVLEGGGPPPFGPKDKSRFASSFDATLTRMLRGERP